VTQRLSLPITDAPESVRAYITLLEQNPTEEVRKKVFGSLPVADIEEVAFSNEGHAFINLHLRELGFNLKLRRWQGA